MNKKPLYWICGILMVLTMAFGIADNLQYSDLAPEDYTITTMTLVDLFAARPIFYASLGMISALKLFNAPENDKLRLGFLIGGGLLILVLAGVAIASILGAAFANPLFAAIRQLFRVPALFLVPGILLGRGFKDED